MLEQAATILLAGAWLACCFQLLQAWGAGERPRVLAATLVLVAGIAVVAARGSSPGFGWLRVETMRSDAIALGVLVPTVTVLACTWRLDRGRPPTALLPAAGAALACVLAGFAALAIGRAGWYWEFVAVIVGGCALAGSGALAFRWQGADANVRVVAGSGVLLGGFFAVGGTALLLAWRAIA